MHGSIRLLCNLLADSAPWVRVDVNEFPRSITLQSIQNNSQNRFFNLIYYFFFFLFFVSCFVFEFFDRSQREKTNEMCIQEMKLVVRWTGEDESVHLTKRDDKVMRANANEWKKIKEGMAGR